MHEINNPDTFSEARTDRLLVNVELLNIVEVSCSFHSVVEIWKSEFKVQQIVLKMNWLITKGEVSFYKINSDGMANNIHVVEKSKLSDLNM